MALSPPGIDTAFYELIHHLVTDSPQDESAERRDGLRNPFPSVQRIAPGHAWEVPTDTAFVEVRCHDLTQRGFSFLLPKPPDFNSLIAAFGEPPRRIYLAAAVLHWREVPPGPPETPGDPPPAPMVLVGCRFLRRVER